MKSPAQNRAAAEPARWAATVHWRKMGQLTYTAKQASEFCVKNNLTIFEAETLTLAIMENILHIDVEFEYKDFRKVVQREYKKAAQPNVVPDRARDRVFGVDEYLERF